MEFQEMYQHDPKTAMSIRRMYWSVFWIALAALVLTGWSLRLAAIMGIVAVLLGIGFVVRVGIVILEIQRKKEANEGPVAPSPLLGVGADPDMDPAADRVPSQRDRRSAPLTCYRCKGSGEVFTGEIENETGYANMEPCPRCGGRGEIG